MLKILMLTVLGTALMIPAGSARGAVALDRDPTNVPLDGTIKVSPASVEMVDLSGGSTRSFVLTVRNRRPQTIIVRLAAVGVLVVDPRTLSTSRPLLDDVTSTRLVSGGASRTTAAPWLSPEVDTIKIPPRGVARIPVTVQVPAQIDHDERYGAVAVRTVGRITTGSGAAVGVETQIAVPVLITVGDRPRPQLKRGPLKAPRLVFGRRRWTAQLPIENTGSTHAVAAGRVTVRSIFGRQMLSTSFGTRTLLPGARTRPEITWQKTPWFGVFSVSVKSAVVVGADQTQERRTERLLVVLPPFWILAVAGGLGALALALRSLRARRLAHSDEDAPLEPMTLED